MEINDHKRYAMFIGRWQPLHDGHIWLIQQALDKGKDVCVAIRNTEISEKNPYTIAQREEMIKRVFGDKVITVTIPDIESINIGRKVGYDVIRMDPPKDIGEISGTNVRKGIEKRIADEVSDYTKLLKTTFWLTGLPCSGKTTIANRLHEELINHGYQSVTLDGDDIRSKLNEDLGFSDKDREENLRRVAHTAQLFNDKGNIVIASFVSPTERLRALPLFHIEHTKMIFVRCSVEECIRRDVKGMYKKALNGEIREFTGVSAPFEEPEDSDLIVDTESTDVDYCVKQIIDKFGF